MNTATLTAPVLALPYGDRYRLVVRKEGGLFTLRTFRNGRQIEFVQAFSAQAIKDYIDANWPVGTTAQWIIVPPFAPVRSGKTFASIRVYSRLKSFLPNK